jgi:radical SAM superfamily enzyme YgiQ (UPF0313 family)
MDVSMDLLLVHPYFISEDAQEQRVMKPYPPLGLLYLSSYLKARGVDVGIFDGTFQRERDFVLALDRLHPPVVGISCNLMTKRHALAMIAECRRRGILVVVGGPDPPHHADRYLAHGADVVVIGEGELTLEELLARGVSAGRMRDLSAIAGLAYRNEAGLVVRTAPRPLMPDLDGQPLPDREAVDVEAYLRAWRERHGTGSVSLITARGCPFTCTWCSRSVFGDSHRRRSPHRVADEVELILDRYHPDMLWYADDVFTIHRGWTLKFAAEMGRRGRRVPFECISRPERISEDVADALASLGCTRLWIGSESGSQRILDAMDRRVTIDQVQVAARRLRARGIQVGMFIMLGYEGEEVTDLRATIRHLRRAAPDVFLTTVAYPIRGTPYYDAVASRVAAPRAWDATTDRESAIRGRHSRRYYEFARRWIGGEVESHRAWSRGRYLQAASAAAHAGAARLGMALTAREREA